MALPGDLNSSRTERALLDARWAPHAARSSKTSESGEWPLLHRLLAYLEWGALSPTITSLFD